MSPRLPATLLLPLLLGSACQEEELWCGKVMCEPGQYCLHDWTDTGDPLQEPDCLDAPAACGDEPDCDCLSGCTECDDDDQPVHCIVE